MENEFITRVQRSATSCYVYIPKYVREKLGIKKGDVVKVKILDVEKGVEDED